MNDNPTADATPVPRDHGPLLVSVGMPVFNGERLIREAIDSVLSQEQVNLEIVISDNASTDGTRSLCEEYARRDGRVRYHRNEENLGISGNFKKALELARGTYFTWLAHDDSFASPSCLAEHVNFLKSHPDVVLCGCSMRVFDEESPEISSAMVLDAILPDRNWPSARMEFFRWPQPATHLVLYGIYRRAALLQTPLDGRVHRGKPVATDMEYPILANLCRHGRIVALPQILRNSRSVANSTACREMERFSSFDFFCLALKMKLTLLKTALRLRLPLREKMGLLKVVLGNFFRAHFGQRPRFTECIKALRREVAGLHRVCEERLQLIHLLDGELKKQVELIRSFQQPIMEAKVSAENCL